MKPIIEVKNLSKKYRISTAQPSYLSLRDSLAHIIKKTPAAVSALRTGAGSVVTEEVDFWALEDVNFTVEAGESMGIIGKNGAGKSTLLKILSRITPPTSGNVILRGRLVSLLEVGTGFHLELSGRENVYFNGSILGLKKSEIDRKFDEIVDFSGMEKFIDTPLKHYSTGMQLRLAFAVAAHLEPEILIIDEVLAVGDAEFQQKCFGKMGDVARSGRTVLFVSHNMGAVQALCPQSILLDKGKVAATGKTSHVINQYLHLNRASKDVFKADNHTDIYFNSIEVLNNIGEPQAIFSTDEPIKIRIQMTLNNPSVNATFIFFLHALGLGKRLFLIEENTKNLFNNSLSTSNTVKTVTITLPSHFLMPNMYNCEIGLFQIIDQYIDRKESVANFEVIHGNNPFLKYGEREIGYVFPQYEIKVD